VTVAFNTASSLDLADDDARTPDDGRA